MKKKKKLVGIIGHFGGPNVFYDGQTVKTKNLKKLVEEYGEFDTYCVDTYLNKTNKVKLLLKTFSCLFKCKKIFILLSENGMGFYLPFLHKVNKIFKRKIFHYIIGSEILKMVEDEPKLVKYLNSLTVNWFEYESGRIFLQEKGVTNVEVLPNCKILNALDIKQVKNYKADEQLKFCTISRVMPEKGITDAILTVDKINREKGKIVATLDVYGPLEDSYKEEFNKLCADYESCVSYKGMADSAKSVEVLKDYFALLFPTRWKGEGFPGTILDAFASGVPVIASDWNANKELLTHGKTGMLYPSKEFNELFDAVKWSVENVEQMIQMRINCREEYEKYTPESVGNVIIKALNKE